MWSYVLKISKTNDKGGNEMPKNIIFCADGTWNNANQDDNNDNIPDWTNVFKLFLFLDGKVTDDSLKDADEQEKSLMVGDVANQVAKYIHGVGDSRNPIVKLMGGAFGSGIITRIVRGYTFISRNYDPGDDIFIVGFSRGAYTARALAGFIGKQGLLAKDLTNDKEQAYRKGAEAWYRYRKSTSDAGLLQRLTEYAADLPAFLSANSLKDSDFVPVENKIKAVGVWDTVGAMGIPDFEGDKRLDAFRFADTRLSDNVRFGLHAVSLDEQRVDFTPTPWEQREGIKQVLFPGDHADVGGGYPTTNQESELSDGALKWMVDELKALDVKFSTEPTYDPVTYPGGKAHEPWRNKPYKTKKREFPSNWIGHCSLGVRAAGPAVCPDPQAAPEKYNPPNMPTMIGSGGPEKLCASCVKC